MRTTVLSETDQWKTIRREWADLASAMPLMGAFATPAWHRCWLRHIAPTATSAVVAVHSPDDALVGLAPFAEYMHRDRGFAVPAVGFMGREVVSGDYFDVLARPDDRDAVRDAIFGHVAARLRAGRMVVWSEIVRGSDTDVALRAWLDREGYRYRVQEERICPYIALPDSYEAYLASRSRNTRSLIRRRTRRLLQDQGCTLEVLRGADAVVGLADLFALHAARWESRGETGTFVRPGFQEFVADFVRNAPDGVEPLVYRLAHEGRAIACMLFFRTAHATVYYQGGLDPDSDFARESPGLVLMGRAIADAIEAGSGTFDFLRGDEGYKRKFTNDFRRTYTVLVAGRSARAHVYFAALAAKQALRRFRHGPPPPLVWGDAPETPAPPLQTQLRAAAKHAVLAGYVRVWTRLRDLWRGLRGRCETSVLVYHRISDEYRDSVTVGVEEFRRQMRAIQRRFDVVDLATAVAERGQPQRRPRVVVTFDDGYRDNHFAARVMKAAGIPCTFFISTGIVGTGGAFPGATEDDPRGPALTWDEVREIRSWGFTVGNHTVNHVDLARVPLPEAVEEVQQASRDLLRQLDEPAERWLAYPFGYPDNMTHDLYKQLRRAGIDVCLSAHGGRNGVDFDPLDIKRQGIGCDITGMRFLAAVAGWAIASAPSTAPRAPAPESAPTKPAGAPAVERVA